MRRHLIRDLQKRRKEKLAAGYEDAARDPVYMQYMLVTENEWGVTSPDGLDAAD